LVSCDARHTYPLVSPPPVPGSPVRTAFTKLGMARIVANSPCDVRFVAIASGKASVDGAKADEGPLGDGDVLVVRGTGDLFVQGSALALVAVFTPDRCDAPPPSPSPSRSVARAGVAPALTWAGGAMSAHLDVESANSPDVYFGRLSGTSAVAEHQHDGVREVLCAVEASGTFTIAGEPHRLGPQQCVQIPPSTRHAWAPDAGSTLVAFQLYAPPGPEQRFKALAAAAATGRP
jgi:mannose-6-phosphate isomerase-like protein (cupin superfamily)